MTGAAIASDNVFAPRIVALLVALGVILGLGFLLMSGFQSELSRRFDNPPPSETKSGEGFYGLKRLIDLTHGGDSFTVDRDSDLGASALLIVTPEPGTTRADLAHILAARTNGERPTLIILPKWSVRHPPFTRNRVERTGFVPAPALAAMLPHDGLDIGREPPGPLRTAADLSLPALADGKLPVQLVSGDGLRPLITTASGGIVLAQVTGRKVYILADPDLLDNRALKSQRAAFAALSILAALNPQDPGYVGFDTTLHYRPGERNLIKLMFTPPFLAVTIAMLAAALLAGLASVARFGPIAREPRSVAPGKAALADNIAALTRLAGKTHLSGGRYADWVRDWTAQALRAPTTDPHEREAFLDRQAGDTRPRFTDLARRARQARTHAELLDAARDLDTWRRKMTE